MPRRGSLGGGRIAGDERPRARRLARDRLCAPGDGRGPSTGI